MQSVLGTSIVAEPDVITWEEKGRGENEERNYLMPSSSKRKKYDANNQLPCIRKNEGQGFVWGVQSPTNAAIEKACGMEYSIFCFEMAHNKARALYHVATTQRVQTGRLAESSDEKHCRGEYVGWKE